LIIRAFLNRLLWDSGMNRSDYELEYLHRGAPFDLKTISCALIEEVNPSGFIYKSKENGEVLIPFHRILKIINLKTGQSWDKRCQ